MTGALALLVFLLLLVLVSIDHPFSGPVSVGPGELLLVEQDLGEPPLH